MCLPTGVCACLAQHAPALPTYTPNPHMRKKNLTALVAAGLYEIKVEEGEVQPPPQLLRERLDGPVRRVAHLRLAPHRLCGRGTSIILYYRISYLFFISYSFQIY